MKLYKQKYLHVSLSIGRTIKSLRESKGLTQQALAEKCGYGRANLAKIETGNHDLSLLNLLCLADALECKLDDIIGNHID